MNRSPLSVPRLTSTVGSILRVYAYRAAGAQAILRLLLVFLVILEVFFLAAKPAHAATTAMAVAYTAWVIGAAVMIWRRKMMHPQPCLLIVDLIALTFLLVSAGRFSQADPAASLLDDAYFLVPVLAVLQVQPWITVAISVATAAAYGCGAVLAHAPAGGAAVFSGVLFLLSLGAACVLLSWLQRSRTRTIGNLAKDRDRLLSDALKIEDRERQWLADTLHDGALQSALAARQDFDEMKSSRIDGNPHPAHQRIERALLDVIHQLRSTASGLHPTVLEDLGLTQALRAVGETTAQRANFGIHFRFEYASCSLSSEHQKLLFGAAREFLVNVAKHAGAEQVEVALSCDERVVRLAIIDDGVGILPEEFREGLTEGHLGLASQRVRIESVDGCMNVEPRSLGEKGTVASVTLPRTLRRPSYTESRPKPCDICTAGAQPAPEPSGGSVRSTALARSRW
ncbi:ATP-binding protein [Streptomyces sp. NPDC096030]|uniref:sensor histidine kinase n=1 Tax=Streptomyces sp. NPDC096030 TaxID=3155423 RepID=UPI00333101B6